MSLITYSWHCRATSFHPDIPSALPRIRRQSLSFLEPYRRSFLSSRQLALIQTSNYRTLREEGSKPRRLHDLTRFSFWSSTLFFSKQRWVVPTTTRTSVGLPTSRRAWTVLKSAHVHNKARDQYELRTYRQGCQLTTFLASSATLTSLLLHRALKVNGLLNSRVRLFRRCRHLLPRP